MNLIENEEYNKRNKKNKTIMIVIIVLIIFLLIICGVLVFLINEVQRNRLKLNVDNVSTNFADDMFIIDGDTLYVAIKDFGALMGYETFNGDYKTKYTEDTTNCYISNANEVASFSLNSNTIYKKVTTNEDYEYFDIEKPVIRRNNKLYVSSDGIEIGTNSLIRYNGTNNLITVYSLDYMISNYSETFPNGAFIEDDADFNNKKALRYGLVVVMNQEKYYGVVDTEGKEIIGAKYRNISFNEGSQEFTVTTSEGREGILTIDGKTKIEPNYTEIKKISEDLGYYLVRNDNEKYGVINENGNIVIYLEFDQIGVDEDRFSTNGIENPYILYDNCIPVLQNKKWQLFDINGNRMQVVDSNGNRIQEFDSMGCVERTQSNALSTNVLLIPQYEAIVVGVSDQYGIISSLGELYVPIMLDTVYSTTVSGETQYYMAFTLQVQEDGELVDRQFTYNVDQYFEQYVEVHTSSENENENATDTNTVDTNTTVTNTTTNNANETETTGNNGTEGESADNATPANVA